MKEQHFTTNQAPDPLAALRKANCCACGRPITNSKFVNVVITNYRQDWEYPAACNIITAETHGASAVLCDACIEAKAQILHVIEIRDGQIILHPVSDLEELDEECHLCGNAITQTEAIALGMCPDCFDEQPRCRICGCTDDDCSQCVAAQGYPCHWVEDDLCSRCADTTAA